MSVRSALRLIVALSETQIRLSETQIKLRLTPHTAALSLSLIGNCAPWARFPVFVINKARFSSSKLVRAGLKSCCYCIVYYFGIKKALEARSMVYNAFHVWMMIVKCL